MARQTYTQYIQTIISEFKTGDPILIHALGKKIADSYHLDQKKACAAAAVAVKRIRDAGTFPELRCFGKGIYFLTKQTVFGEVGINKEKLIELKYLAEGNGYETGTAMMHKIGLTSLMPAERVFVSNKAQGRSRTDEALGITVRSPKVMVDKSNLSYLQFLDLLSIYDEVPVDADDPFAILGGFIHKKNLDYGKLLHFADHHYNNDTIIRLAHVAGREGVRI